MKIIKRFLIFFVVFILYHIILSNFFPVNEENILLAPDWYIPLGILTATIIAVSWKRTNTLQKWLKWAKTSEQPDTIPKSITEPIIEPVTQHTSDMPTIKQESSFVPLPESIIAKTCHSPTIELIDSMDGHEFECWCADLLQKNGFINVSVTKASGDQGVDVLAEKEGIRYAIQCKCYTHDLGNKPIQEVYTGKRIYGCQIGTVMTNRYFTKGAKKAAEQTGVLLWDRDWILSHLQEKEHHISPSIPMTNDSMLWDAWALIKESGIVSVSLLERRLKIGYARAARIIDELEELGYVGPFVGSKPREILK